MKKKLFIFFILSTLFLNFYLYFIKSDAITSYPENLEVHFIDVGQGDAILIRYKTKTLLMDSGSNSNEDDFFDYLDSQNINKFDYVICTHPHEDHIGNMKDLINTYPIDYFFAPKVTTTSKTFEDMVFALLDKDLKIYNINTQNNLINISENISFSVITENNTQSDNLNNYSPIIRLKFNDISFLFTGDAEAEVEDEAVNSIYSIESDVLKIGHHGSDSSTTSDFLNEVSPKIAIISCGIDNKYDHPHKSTLDKLKAQNIDIYRTDIDGDIVFSSDGNTLKNISN